MGASYLAEGGRTQYPEIDRRAGLSLREFRRDYLYPGKPVVITGAAGSVKAQVVDRIKRLFSQ